MSAHLSPGRVELTQGRFATISAADFDLVRPFRWHAVRCGKRWYAARSEWRGGRTTRVYMHRHLLFGGASSEMLVDHINGDGLDNRRENLRATDCSQNNLNSVAGRGATGLRGVYAQGGKFMVRVADIYAGVFDNLPEAAFRANQLLESLSPGIGQRNAVDWDALIATLTSRRDSTQADLDRVLEAAHGR